MSTNYSHPSRLREYDSTGIQYPRELLEKDGNLYFVDDTGSLSILNETELFVINVDELSMTSDMTPAEIYEQASSEKIPTIKGVVASINNVLLDSNNNVTTIRMTRQGSESNQVISITINADKTVSEDTITFLTENDKQSIINDIIGELPNGDEVSY